MKTLVLSSSLNPDSKGFVLCKMVSELLNDLGREVEFVDLRDYKLGHTFSPTEDMKVLKEKIAAADNFVIGMAVYCYSINDSLKTVLDNCFSECEKKPFGIICAAGGQKSYLATQHLTQICMNEWRMPQLPRVIYTCGEDWNQVELVNSDLMDRVKLFASEFLEFSNKLQISS